MIKILKKTKAYEYKLDKSKIKQNEALAVIRHLKEEVNLVRRERVFFYNVFEK